MIAPLIHLGRVLRLENDKPQSFQSHDILRVLYLVLLYKVNLAL